MAEKIVEKFESIGLSGPTIGNLTINEKGLEWRSATSTKIVQAKDILRAMWSVFGKWGHLRLFLRNGKAYRYDGFTRNQFDRMKEIFTTNFGMDLSKEELHAGGVNYGDLNFEDNTLVMTLDDKAVLELPLGNVSQCVIPGNSKSDVELQFVETDAADRDEDALVEVRFFVPPSEEEDEETAAQKFQSDILSRANVQSSTGDALVSFTEDEGFFLFPRGRYAINLYANSFRIHGAKYDHKMAYTDIIHFFLLDRADKRWAFVIGLSKPIRQGQQRYNYLVLQTHDGEGEVTVNLSEEELKEKYEDKLEKNMVGPMHHLLAKTFKVLSGKKVYHSQKFTAADGTRAVKCSLKANEGLLYPLDKAFMFIYKPTLYIPFKDMDYVSFERASNTTRSFDLKIAMRPLGAEQSREYIFQNIDRKDHARLGDYLREKPSIKVYDERPQQKGLTDLVSDDDGAGGEDDDEEEEDEDYKGSDGEGGSSGASGSGSGSGSDDDSSSGAEMVEESDLEGVTNKKKDKPIAKKKGKGAGAAEGKKKRKKKDPNAPKRALTAFIYFSNDHRAKIKEDNPGATIGEVGKLLGEKWKTLDAEAKKEFEEKAKVDKERYQKEKADYDAKKAAVGEVVDSDEAEDDE